MYTAPIPVDDDARVAALHSYGVLDTEREQGYDDVTFLASHICETPYSTITLVDRDRQFFKSEHGFGTRETNRSDGICACAINAPSMMVVGDLKLDERFRANPFVADGPQLRFYAGAPLITPDGHIIGTVCVFDDKPRELRPDQLQALSALARQVMARMELHRKMQDDQRAADALRTAEKLAAVGRMASAVAHEINNPLQSVTNLLYMVQRTEDRDTRDEFMTMAQDELARVTHIVTQALRFHAQSRLPESVRVGEIAESVMMLFRTRFSHAGARLQFRDTQTEPVVCYVDDVRQVLSHLLANALDALTVIHGGTFHVRVSQGSSHGRQGVRLTVADTGCGIDAGTLSRLFQPFNTTKGIRGTGLGLWVSRGVLQRRGGHIRVRSKAGRGTVVRIFLPMTPVDALPDAAVDELAVLGLAATSIH